MATGYIPSPFLFTEAAGSGLKLGAGLAGLFQERRNRSKLQEIADQVRAGAYESAGSDLIGMGEFQPGLNLLNLPFNRDLDAQKLALDRQQLEQGGLPSFTSPVQAFDEQGNPVFIQSDKAGNVRPIQGFRPMNPVQKVDAGTHWEVLDGRTGQVISRMPKQNTAAQYQETLGAEQAKADVAAGPAAAKTNKVGNDIISFVDQVMAHPGMDSAMGIFQGRLPSIMANPMDAQNVEDFRALKDQLTGAAFLQAFESLKGAGQITEVEGRKATDALLAMRDTQDPKQFRQLLKTFRDNVELGMRLAAERDATAQQRMGQYGRVGQQPMPAQAQPAATAGQGLTRETAIQVRSEAEADALPPGTWVIFNGRIGRVE